MHDPPPRLTDIDWSSPYLPTPSPLNASDRGRLQRTLGYVPSYAATIAAVPWVLESVIRTGPAQQAHLSYALVDLVTLVVSQDNACRYCYGAARTQLQLTGYTEAAIRNLETDLAQATLPERDRLLLEAARQLSRSNPRPDAAMNARLQAAGIGQPEWLEAALVAALTVYWTRLFTGIAAQPDAIEQLPQRWYGALARLAVGWMMRRRRLVSAVAMPPQAKTALFGELFAALDGIPAGATLFSIVDDALRSTTLPLRLKMLTLAVIARAAGCDRSEQEARTILTANGTAPALLDTVLRTLSADELTPLEAWVIPLARETVRYRTAPLQRRMREVASRVSPPEFIEIVALCALWNAMVRLTAVRAWK